MSKKYEITADLFILPYRNEDYILYAPRVGLASIVNQDTVNFLSDLDSVKYDNLKEEEKTIIDFFSEKGILNGSKEFNCINQLPEQYTPTLVTLFTGNQCNLRCIYCYASAGECKPMKMSTTIAFAAIEKVIENLKSRGMKNLSLGFHGGGEPFYEWKLVREIVSYTEERCEENGIEHFIYSATNGVLSEKQLEWIIKHFKNLNISFDGLPQVQDYHRPLTNGKGSFEFLDRTFRFLDDHNFPYGIRGTISDYNIGLMEDTIDFIGQNYKCKSLHLEPLFYCGRCKTTGTMCPDIEKFEENFIKCQAKAAEYGINLVYSGCHIEFLRNSFCGVSSDNFSVTPDGYITACYEVTEITDPRSDKFFIGRINEDGSIYVNEEKRKFLHLLTVDKLDYCKDCFAKWHCAGECAAKLEPENYTGVRGNERCLLNRKLIYNNLVGIIEGTYKNLQTNIIKSEIKK
jgi:uncharacterized protein